MKDAFSKFMPGATTTETPDKKPVETVPAPTPEPEVQNPESSI